MLHARYHHSEFLRIVGAHLDDRLADGMDIWTLSLPVSTAQAAANNLFFIECEAHFFAAAQAIHAAGDILAHVVYYGLGLNRSPGSGRQRVSLHWISDRLKRLAQTDATLAPINNELVGLLDSAEFQKLSELVNQLKHHGGPTVTMALEPAADQSYEMRFDDFMRDGTLHPSGAVSQALKSAFERVNVAVVHAGKSLNTWLSHSAYGADRP
jgi:hypothetical protein